MNYEHVYNKYVYNKYVYNKYLYRIQMSVMHVGLQFKISFQGAPNCWQWGEWAPLPPPTLVAAVKKLYVL